MATLVKFYTDRGCPETVFAAFPQLFHNRKLYGTKYIVCYAQAEQHGSSTKDYLKECPVATQQAYRPLQKELEQIGYKLQVLNKQ